MLLFWEECIDHFSSGSGVAGVAKSLLIYRMKELLLFENLIWFFNILPLGELVWKLDSDSTCVSKFSRNKHSLFSIYFKIMGRGLNLCI